MLRDIPYVVTTFVLAIFLMLGIGYYYQTSIKQDSVILTMNETVRTLAIASADNKSRVNEGELFIVKEDFEEKVIEKLQIENNVAFSENVTYRFEYLDNENGSTKAVRIIIEDGDTTYQSTAKVDIAE